MNNLLAQVSSSRINNPILGTLNSYNAPNGGATFFSKFISGLISLSLVVASVIFLFMLIIGSIQWISSGGDKQAVEGARGKITNALIGVVLLFSVFAIIKLIETFFGITILTLDLAPLVIQ